MPPRGRPKAGTSRMDAAVDAMKKFGFEEKLTKLTVRELLKVYGGIEAWPLIEDDCYGTLLEILLKKNQEEQGGEQSRSNSQEGADQLEGENQLEGAYQLEGENQLEGADQMEGENQLEGAYQLEGENQLEGVDQLEGENQLEGVDQPEGENQLEQTMVLEQHVETTPEPPNDAGPPSDITDNTSVAETENTGTEEFGGGDENLEATPMISDDINLPQTILPPQPPVEAITKPRRKPCYGWISDGDEGNDDDVVYVPAPVPSKPKRKSRWDVTPN